MECDHTDAVRPKRLGDPAAKTARIAQLRETHIAPLTHFVETLRIEAGPGASIPDFDPWDAGVEAEILFLLEAPGAKAVASTFVSRDNPDETAKNVFELHREAGIPRKKSLLWNAVPWYIGDGARIRAATPEDLEQGLKPLPRLIRMLPKLRAVVFMGKNAHQARPQVALLRPDLALFACAHPSPKVVNTRPGNREGILTVLREVARYLEGTCAGAWLAPKSPEVFPAATKKPMRDKQVAYHITQVLNSLAAHSGIGKPLEEGAEHAFSAEICALQRALALLGVTSEPESRPQS